MAGTFLGKYDTTAANNTATGTNTVSVAEGMLPSNINNAFRSVMADIRQHYNTAEWIEYGDGAGTYTATYASATSFTIDGVDVTAIYHAGRRVKVVASTPGTIYGTISSTSFSTNTTVNVTWDSSSLSSEAITSVYIGVLAKTNNSIPTEIIATANIADGSVTLAKMAVNSIDSDQYVDASIDLAHMSVNSIDSDQYVDASIDTAHLAADVITGAKIADDAIDSEHITDGSIDTAHIAADQITNAKIADDQIDSEHYVDGSIDLAHLSADSVNGAKIVDDAIDSEHYTDGSIDTAHIADLNVTLAKLAASSVNSSKIVDDSIVNADINSSAAIDATKIADGTVTSAEFQYINTLSSNAQTQIDAKAATTYVDEAVAGLRTRIIAECASTANVTISSALEAGDTIDGITLVAGDRVLLKDQSTASENGLYTAVASGAASRDTQFNTIAELSGQMVVVNQGSVNDNKIFLCTTNNTASLGSDSITFTTITPQNVGTVTSITAGTGLSGGAITSSGTIAIDSTVATLTGTQTLTNKTLTSPKINEDVVVTSTATELNLLDGVSGLVQADFTKLAAIDASAAEIDTLDGLSRGSIIYGNASAATTVLTKGTVGQVLTSDGTDISWDDASSGRTGTVDWQTGSIKTSTFTAANGEGYFANTTGSAFDITLPSSPSVGDIVAIADYANNWGTNAITLLRNGSNIEGAASDLGCNTTGAAVTLVYADASKGWIVTSSGNSNQASDIKYVVATGGTITTSGNDRIHTFTGPGTFTITCAGNPFGSSTYSYHVIAGGGASGYGYGSHGGAGGYRSGGCYGPSPLRASAVAASLGCSPITIGGGGTPTKPTYGIGGNGTNTVGLGLTAAGGGGGAGGNAPDNSGNNGNPGGSGGGASGGDPGGTFSGGTGNTPPVSPPQGQNGAPAALGNGYGGTGYYAQGGGAGSAGGPYPEIATPTGVPSTISGSDIDYASGGPIPATANRGGGGNAEGNNGNSGVVIVRYKYQN